jgi:predicted acetyltransferase
MHDLLRRFQDEGYPVSALYPFRPSFYGRIGYLGLPAAKTVTLRPADLSALLATDLPGEVRLRRIADAWDDFTGFLGRHLARQHGLAEFPGYRLQEWRDTNDRWLATAHLDGEVAAMAGYRITDYAGDLTVESLLHTGPLSRALLLRFLARHVDQVDRIVARVAPDERPELWTTDFTGTIASTVKIPDGAPPMVRVLNLAALAGLPAGEAQAQLEIIDDPLIGGRYLLDGAGGALSVKPGAGTGEVKLSAAALAGLVYGVLDPDDVVARGLATIPAGSRQALRTMFPPAAPYVLLSF